MDLFFVSLGCDKNLVDSEFMLGMLQENGITIIDDETSADIILINTCCFIQDAKEESINTILQMAEYKKSGICKALIVTGCLAQRYQKEIREEIPQVDAVLGTNAYDSVLCAIQEALSGNYYENFRSLKGLPKITGKRSVSTGGHYAYLKIAEGCNKRCTYCIIPYVRGDYRSIPMEDLLTQARELACGGVKELILVAQETTTYGIDLYGKKMLAHLLDELNQVPGLKWIRILYCYPEEINLELIEAIKRNDKVCHYIDMPIQHANDEVLRRMGRQTNKQTIKQMIQKLRMEIPDICIRTTLICGFPGETKEQHEELMEFIDEMEFDRLGAFTYSCEEGTPAAQFPGQLDEDTKLLWQEEVMELEQEIIFEQTDTMKGNVIWAFVEGKLPDENVYVARSYRDAPDIDGLVFITSQTELITGDFVKVRITGAMDYDLTAELEDETYEPTE